MAIVYREASNKDLPFVIDIIKSVFGDAKDISSEQFLVAEDNSKIIGCVRIKNVNDSFELASLAVLPGYRGKGIGSNLVAKILDKFSGRPVYLLCFKERENFYKEMSFEIIEPVKLPIPLKEEYIKILEKPFVKSAEVIAMVCMK